MFFSLGIVLPTQEKATQLLRNSLWGFTSSGLRGCRTERLKRTCQGFVTTILLITTLWILLSALNVAERTERHLSTKVSLGWRQKTPCQGQVALVTMADHRFQMCAVQLIRSARKHGWKEAVYLLVSSMERFDNDVLNVLHELGVMVIETSPAFDAWLGKAVENRKVYRELQASKFRKFELFLNPIFRTYRRVIYLDADGIVGAPLDPMVNMPFPPGKKVLLRQNDWSVHKSSLWKNELAVEMLNWWQRAVLQQRFPDRTLAGASSWIILEPQRLEPPNRVFLRSVQIICTMRAAFRLNDQTLLNLLFYDHMGLIPWCSWDEVVTMDEPEKLGRYCKWNMRLQRRLNGGITFMYRHMSSEEKAVWVSRGSRLEQKGNKRKSEFVDDTRPYLPKARTAHNCMEALMQWKVRLQ